ASSLAGEVGRGEIEKVLAAMGTTQIKLTRSRVETRITLVLKGDLAETEERLKKIYLGIVR
ncbi:MAG: hypothetical protein AAB768_00620, partial [Patescibacteria group bacterium]